MYVIYASERSERALNFSHFHILIMLFPSIFCWYFRYFVSEKYLISGVNILHTYTINAVSFYYSWYGAIYKRQYTDKTLTLRKCMCMRASEASELRKFGYFYILKLLFLSIFCRYIRYFVGTNDMLGLHVPTISQCTDKFPNVPTKVRKGIIGGGGAIAPPLATLIPSRPATLKFDVTSTTHLPGKLWLRPIWPTKASSPRLHSSFG